MPARFAPSRVRSRPLRHAPFALFVGGVLAYGAAFAWRMLDRFDLVNLIRDVNYDDSFYYYQIAWRLAQGEFSTFDGITRTNGYHPLWLLLITPFYWAFDKTEALFAIKAFEIMLVAGGVALAACAARAARLPWVLLFAALPALYGNPALFLGLEAAAGLFMLGLFVLAVCLFARDPGRWRWLLAAAAFALPWARLEYVAVSVAATAALCLLERSWRDGPEHAPPGGPVRSMPGAGVPFLAAGASLLAYFAWNGFVFGGFVPVSAEYKELRSELDWERGGGYSLTRNVQLFLRSGHFDGELLVALEVCVYAAVVWWFSRRSRGRDDRLLLAFLVGVSGLAAGHLAKFAQSVLTVTPRWGIWEWYFVPAYLMETLAVPARCCVAVWCVRRFAPAPYRASGVPRLGIVLAGAVFLFATADFTAPFRFVDRHRDAEDHHDGSVHQYMGAMVMNRVLPEDSVVGAGGSGYIAYFSRFPVMNLDCMVNSRDCLRARREGTEAAFRQRHGITHVADVWLVGRDTGRTALFEGPRHGGRYQFKIVIEEWARESLGEVDRADWFWKRMEPHLERQADGVGLLVDGRTAQAFVRDCAADETAVWTWGAGTGEAALLPWTRTTAGFCTSVTVLPPGARPPVRAASMTAGEYLAARVRGAPPAIDADFDVYLVENRLVYVKEECGPEDVDALFFLHLDPVDPDDLPGRRRRHGFDNLDFRFDRRGARFDGVCLVETPLPEYGVAAIRTGQYQVEEEGFHHLWEGEIRPGPE